MSLSEMQSMVLYTTILITLKLIVSHEIGRNSYTDIWEDPALKNLTSTLETLFALNVSALDSNVELNHLNLTIANGTLTLNTTTSLSSMNPLFPEKPPFYLASLPKEIFLYALLVALQYYWHIALERLFPARSRAVEVDGKKEKAFDDDETRDEEAVKRWIAQGKGRRASVSWRNTFFKWILNLTVGKLWSEAVWHLADGIVMRESLTVTLGELKQKVITCWLMSFFSLGPVASLIGFIVIPTYQRTVFMASMDFFEAIFFSLFWRVVLPWFLKTNVVQRTMVDTTANIFQSAQGGSRKGHVIDEL